jgi:hypothetical protein
MASIQARQLPGGAGTSGVVESTVTVTASDHRAQLRRQTADVHAHEAFNAAAHVEALDGVANRWRVNGAQRLDLLGRQDLRHGSILLFDGYFDLVVPAFAGLKE